MAEVIIASIAAGLGSVITILGKVIVNVIRAKKEPPAEKQKKEDTQAHNQCISVSEIERIAQ